MYTEHQLTTPISPLPTTLLVASLRPLSLLVFLFIFILSFTLAPKTFAEPSITNLDRAVETMERFFYTNYKEYRINTRTQLLDTPFYATNITIRNDAISQVVDFYSSDKYMAMHMFYTKSGIRATRYNQLDARHSTKPYSPHEITKFVNNFLTLSISPLLEFQSRVIEPIPALRGFYLLEVREYYNQQLMQTYTAVSDGDVITFDLIEIGSGIEYGDRYRYDNPPETFQNIDYSNYALIFGNGRGRNKMLIVANLDNTYTGMLVRNYLPLFRQLPSVDIYLLPFPQESRYVKGQLLTNIFSASRIMGRQSMGEDFLDTLTSHKVSQLNSTDTLTYFANMSSNPDQFLSLVQSERIKLAYDNIVFQNLYLNVDVTPWVIYNGHIIKGYNEAMFLYLMGRN